MTLSLLLLMACEPIGPVPGQPPTGATQARGELRVDRVSLDFGVRSVQRDGPAEQAFEVSNVGDATLVVAGLNQIYGDAVFSTDAPALVELAPGASRVITVRFAPTTDGPQEAWLVPNGQLHIELIGEATAPVARLLPEGDLSEPLTVIVGCDDSVEVALLNDGSEVLEIEDIDLVSSADFELVGELPAQLGPGQQARFEVRFAPSSQQGGQQTATVQVLTNDPADSALGLPIVALAVPGSRVSESFDYYPPSVADLLFVVDTSRGLMSETLAEAQDAASVLFEVLDEGQVDWQVSVTTNTTLCHSTYDAYLHRGLYHDYDPALVGPAFAYGLNPSDDAPAALLDQAAYVLGQTSGSGCLSGFLRGGDQLQVILVSLAEEASTRSARAALNEMRAQLDDPETLRVTAVTGQGTEQACPDGGAARDAAQQTGGAELDLCDMSWESLFTAIAAEAIGSGEGLASFPLLEQPVASTLVVSHNGRGLRSWSHDPDLNRILLDGEEDGVPFGGAVTVTYLEAVTCEGAGR